MNTHPTSAAGSNAERGFTLIEILVVVGIIGVVSAFAVPMMGNTMANFRISGDSHGVSNNIALGKMRAASLFSRVRLYVDKTDRSYHLETFDKTDPDPTLWHWVVAGGTTYLSLGVSFGYGVVNAAPPSTTASIGQAALCKNNTNVDIAQTACVIFNSRGVPVDSAGSPTVHTLYITNGGSIYGMAVSASGMIRSWKTPPTVTPTWVLQ